MLSKVGVAKQVYRRDGVSTLLKDAGASCINWTAPGDKLVFDLTKRRIRSRMAQETGLDDIVETVVDIKPGHPPYKLHAMQLKEELQGLAEIAEETNPRTILEIGTASGGSLYTWCRYFDCLEDVISLDLPGGAFGGGYSQSASQLFTGFNSGSKQHFIRSDSHNTETRKRAGEIVRNVSTERGLDFLFLDGDHTYEGVKTDFELYSDLVRDGGVIALHDIVHHPPDYQTVQERKERHPDLETRHLRWKPDREHVDVERFWKELKNGYETKEIISHPHQVWGGIGVVYV